MVFFKEGETFIDPVEVSTACKGLLAKGMVKQYDDEGFPAFMPVSETTIMEPSYREIKQSDL